jgi:hypothetical protein
VLDDPGASEETRRVAVEAWRAAIVR